jgi:hypothetical protein
MITKLLGIFIAVFVIALVVAVVPASAHHGFGVEFDASKCVDLKGTLTGLTWENPHAYFDMEVKEADGKVVKWHLEMVTPNALKRTGTTKADFISNFGKTINARACPAKVGGTDTDKRGSAGYIALSDGLIRLSGQLQNGPKHF